MGIDLILGNASARASWSEVSMSECSVTRHGAEWQRAFRPRLDARSTDLTQRPSAPPRWAT